MREKVRIYRKKNNPVWYGWVFDADGRRINFCTKCTDRRAAILVVKQRERETYAPNRAAKNLASHTVEEALTFLVSESSSDCSPATLEMYAKKGGHLLRLIGNVDVNQLQLDDIQRFINDRQAEGAKNTTIYKELVTLRKALTLARGRNKFAQDPRNIFPAFSAAYVPKRRFLDAEEFDGLLAHLAEKRRLFVVMTVYLGLRLSEALSLDWADVDLERGWVLIAGTKTQKSRRLVPLPPALKEILSAEKSKKGRVLSPWGNVRRDLAVACEKAGIDPVTPNDLRRTFASWLKQAGVDSFTVGKLMGHTTSRMVELVYGHLNDEAFIGAMQELPDLGPLPAPGSQWVAKRSGSPETGETHETSPTQKHQVLRVPKAGIEPATRGFSKSMSRPVRPQLRLVFPKKAGGG